jgi:hypothetical protein
MPKATHTDTTSTPRRRGLLASAAALVAAYAATLPTSALAARSAAHGAPMAHHPDGAGDDTELLAVCRTFAAENAIVTAWDAGTVTEEVGEAAHDKWWACIRAAEEMPAHTIGGVRAKAAMALKGLEMCGDSQSSVEDLARATLGEIAAWGALS